MSTSVHAQSVYANLISGQRNMFVSSTVAIALIGFSNSFRGKTMRIFLTALGSAIFILSIFIGLTAGAEFASFLDAHPDLVPKYIPEGSWEKWPYLNYAFITIIFVFFVTFTINTLLA